MACALMETVFHDVPHTADLSSAPLRKLGVTRRQLIGTEKKLYPATRAWAAAIHRGHPQVQGPSWVSGQDGSSRAVVLFGDRVRAGAVVFNEDSRSLAGDPAGYDAVLDLADRIAVGIVPGSSRATARAASATR